MEKVASVQPQATEKRDKKVSSILITQPKPADEQSPFYQLAEKFKIKIDFRSFTEVEGIPLRDFRKQKINFLDYTAVIFTSRNAVDHYFRMCQEMKVEMPPEMKYFCVSEQTANYLQKYITIRKRKIFTGNRTPAELIEVLKKHKNEKYIYPCQPVKTDEIPTFLASNNYVWVEAFLYNTVASDLSDLAKVNYDVLAFFSPSSVESLFKNFPNFEQKGTRIAAFGKATAKAITDANLILDIEAPQPNAPSMHGALELYLKKSNGSK